MISFSDFVELLKVRHWYKNTLVFVGIIFSMKLFEVQYYLPLIMAFFSFCFASSAGYIFNDIFDKELDKKHPEKKLRPIAKDRISVRNASYIAFSLLLLALTLAYVLPNNLFLLVLLLFVSTVIYSVLLKRFMFLDVIIIAINQIIRAIAGCIVISVEVSPWLVICVFLMALLLAFSKRDGDLVFEDSMGEYTSDFLKYLSFSTISMLLISYFIYASLVSHKMLFTIPVVTFIIFRFAYLTQIRKDISRNAPKVFTDLQILIGVFIWLIQVLVFLYF